MTGYAPSIEMKGINPRENSHESLEKIFNSYIFRVCAYTGRLVLANGYGAGGLASAQRNMASRHKFKPQPE